MQVCPFVAHEGGARALKRSAFLVRVGVAKAWLNKMALAATTIVENCIVDRIDRIDRIEASKMDVVVEVCVMIIIVKSQKYMAITTDIYSKSYKQKF